MTALAPVADFPLLARRIEGRRIVYLDSAATTLKPRAVIARVVKFYEESSANIHRGQHTLSQEASEQFEAARDTVARFLNATAREIVFVANATEAFNLVAAGLDVQPGDNIVVGADEHHSNLLPWFRRCEVRLVPGGDGPVDVEALERLIDRRTRLVAHSHASNVSGVVHPVRELAAAARRHGVPVLIDGSQSVPHLPTDVTTLGCDFLAFSGHKMLGPSGVGVLYLSEAMRERIQPLKLGGGVVDHVRTDGYSLKRAPHRFEAGTPNIEGVLGLAAAVEYLERLGMERVAAHGVETARLLVRELLAVPGLELLGGEASPRIAIASIVPANRKLDPAALGTTLSDSFKVMTRAGTHCAHPYFAARGLPGAVRFSGYVYTTTDDVTEAAAALREVLTRLSRR